MRNHNPYYLTILSLWMGHLLVDFMVGIWAVYKTIAGLDLAICGLIAGACALIGESMQVVFGPLTDRGYRTHLIIGGMALTIASTFLAYTDNYFVLFVFFLMTCLGSGAFHPSAVSLVNSLSQKRKGLLMTIFQSGGGVGLGISQMIFAYTFFLFEGNTIVLALPTLILAAALFFKPSALPQAQVKESPRKISLKAFGEFFRHKDLSKLYVSQVCNQTLLWATMFLLPDVLLSRGYDSWICFGGGHLFFIFGASLMMVPGGYLADKYSCKEVIVYGNLAAMLIFYAFLGIPMLSNLALLSLLFVFGAAAGVINPVSIAFGNRLMPQHSGSVSAFLMGMVWCVSEGLGQGGGGLLSKLFQEDAAAKALGCLGIFFLIGLYVSVRLPKEIPVEAAPDLQEPINLNV